MKLNHIQIRKFRSIYKYSYDNNYLHLFFKKGKSVIEDKYKLNELSEKLETVKVRPNSVPSDLIIAFVLFTIGILILFFSPYLWVLNLAPWLWVTSFWFIFKNIGYFLPQNTTFVSYADNDGGLYMFRDNTKTKERELFESGLIEAIISSKKM